MQESPIYSKLNLADDQVGSLGWKNIFPHGHWNLDSHMLPTSNMDPIIDKVLSQKDVNRINNCVLETLKRIGASLEVEDDDSNNDLFCTPPNNPLKPIFIKLEAWMAIDHGRRHSCILLDYHLKICDQILYPPSRLHHPP